MTLFDARVVPMPGDRPQVKLVVAYDGTDFSGFAAQPGQPGVRTVGGVLAHAIAKVLRHDVQLACAGRTDAGVHAWGQVVSFPSEPGLDPWRLQTAVSSMLGPEIVDPRRRARRAGVRRAALGDVAALPLHGAEPARARSVPRPLHVVGARAARPARAAARGRSVRRQPRLRVVLPQGPGGLVDRRGA